MDKEKEMRLLIKTVTGIVMALIVLVAGAMYGCPKYIVYTNRMQGEAALAKSIAEKQVAVQAALAKKDSAGLLAEAEVLRAQGVANANNIIGNSLKDNEAYLRWLWIEHMAEGNKEVIYIPTEAGIPILEAGKR